MKKYDCSKVVDYAHEYARLHDTDHAEWISNNYGPIDGQASKFNIAEHYIETLQKWSDAHPEITRWDKFLELINGTEFEDVFKYDTERSKNIGCTVYATATKEWWDGE